METVPGYRLVRKLGEGARAEVWLAHSLQSEDSVVALKIFRPATTMHSIDVEIEALGRGTSPHLLAPGDIATGSDHRPALVFPRLSSISLSRLLVGRSSLTAGEVVTAIAPVLGAVSELHRVGVVHGAIDATSIILDSSGAPVLAAFGRAAIVGTRPVPGQQSLTRAERETQPGFIADQHSLAALIGVMVSRISEPSESVSADQLVDWMLPSVGQDDFLDTLAGHLFDLAAALPLLLDDPPTPRHRPVLSTGRVIIPIRDPDHAARVSDSGADRRAVSLSQMLTRLGVRKEIHRFVQRLRAMIAPVRPPIWIAGSAGAVALVLALAVIPAVGSDGAAGSPGPIVGSANSSESSGTAQSDPLSSIPTSTDSSASDRSGDIGSDDPLAAATILLSLRQGCLERKSISCLDGVEQSGSAAHEADRYAIGRGSGAAKFGGAGAPQLTLVQRLGDSAIIGLGDRGADSLFATSILVVKVGDGWRIRDLTSAASSG